MEMERLKQKFVQSFDGEHKNLRTFFAPGRINLIGEHIDYNGGSVFPCALHLGTYGVAAKHGDPSSSKIRFCSGNIDLPVDVDINSIKQDKAHDWANYPKGVVAEFIKLGHNITGFDLYVESDLPSGAGLSSSASLELLTAVVINNLFNINMPMKEMALLCQRAENQFIGVNCGIMDQYTVAMGKKQHALLLDCAKIEHEYVPFNLGEYKIVIANTNKKHALGDSGYNTRRAECDEALRILQQAECDARYLCDLTPQTLDKHINIIEDTNIRNRAIHAVHENARVNDSVSALTSGDLVQFGKLINQSHVSLRDLYEVSCKELDILAQTAWETKGVLGSRMVGAGFGGCTISIVANDEVDNFIKHVGEEYRRQTGIIADFYIAETGDGATEIV